MASKEMRHAPGPGRGAENQNVAGKSVAIQSEIVKPDMLAAALAYVAKGWRVFPCKKDKSPRIPGGHKAATTSRDQVKAWWRRWPDASIGCPTGPAMGWVLDVDQPDGPATLADLEAKRGALPATLEQRTGGGGRQLFFKWPEGREVRCSAGKLGLGLDVRGAGGYVILPPSGHPSGGRYAWTSNGASLAEAPEWLLGLVTNPPRAEAPKPEPVVDQDKDHNVRRAVAYLLRTEPAIEGQGGDARTYATAARLKDLGVSQATALDLMLEHYNPRCLPPWDTDDLGKKVENAFSYAQNPAGSASLEAVARMFTDFEDVGAFAGHDPGTALGRFQLAAWRADLAYTGIPQKREYLVHGVFPMGQLSLLAAAGGVGKSFSSVALVRDCAMGMPESLEAPRHFGSRISKFGRAVYLSGEDDQLELHNRLTALGGAPENLYAVPCPSAGGAPVFFTGDRGSPRATDQWRSFVGQLAKIKNLVAVVIDPLQVFAALDLNCPDNAQAVCSHLSALAAKTGAAVIVSHHFRKSKVSDAAGAREAIRGTTGLVDGMRSVYALWTPPDDDRDAQKSCRLLGRPYEPGRVVRGAVVKANGLALKGTRTFYRVDSGVLEEIAVQHVRPEALENEILSAVSKAAAQGLPYTRTGQSSLFSRRTETSGFLKTASRKKIDDAVGALLDRAAIVQAAKGRGAVKWLDVPDGPFATGVGEFSEGSLVKEDTTW